jgi:hypothetical protein
MDRHETSFRNKIYDTTSREILCYGDAYMEVIEELEDEDRDTLIARLIVLEAHHIKTVDCVNKNIPGRTHAEWIEDNKEWLQEYNATPERKAQRKLFRDIPATKEKKQLYNQSPAGRESQKKSRDKPEAKARQKIRQSAPAYKEQQNTRRSVSILCECGLHYTLGHKARHIKSKRHQAYLKSLGK